MMVSSAAPPHDLQLVIDFVNTRDVEAGEDRIATPERLARWLRERGLGGPSLERLDAGHVSRTSELREALRDTLLAHTRGDGECADALERAAARGRLSISFAGDGAVRISPRASGFDGVLAQLLVPVAHAALDGTWQRVKACDSEGCLEAFYDRSRNRTGRWCDMAVCGNRTKVRAYRARRDS